MYKYNLHKALQQATINAVEKLYNTTFDLKQISFQSTRKEFEGDVTLVVFPFTKISKKGPEQTANEIGEYLKQHCEIIQSYNVIKGFLNLLIKDSFWISFFNHFSTIEILTKTENPQTIMVEYSSPNTNKPLHLGHIRNNLLGYSVSELLKVVGHKVIKVNLINDRGIHICKSMLAWQKWGNNETPTSSGSKGDHLVGKYYVLFDKEHKKQISELKNNGLLEEEAEKQAPLMIEVQEMLRQWEAGNNDVVALWKKMNSWVYEGFDKTYKELGVNFDRFYYESETYLLGKKIVEEGLRKGVFFKKEDGSVWIDLTADGLDQKLLLRKDGTSVYITQDLGTALQRFEEYKQDKMIYVVGNEQDYHFKVLKLILKKMGYEWADAIYHLSYGMVDLPSGKMKSREGTVVDADDLITEMIDTARQLSKELGKSDHLNEEEANKLYKILAMGALKYFILKVDPQKRMVFNPAESIDFNGNTGPFIQYTYARIQSLLKKAALNNLQTKTDLYPEQILPKEKELIKILYAYQEVIKQAAESLSPALVANYTYELTKEYNQFYQDVSILKAETPDLIAFRLQLSECIGNTIKAALQVLGIEAPERM